MIPVGSLVFRWWSYEGGGKGRVVGLQVREERDYEERRRIRKKEEDRGEGAGLLNPKLKQWVSFHIIFLI